MLRKTLKVFGVIVAVVVVLAALASVYVMATWDRDYSDTPVPAITASADPAVIARGEYVVQNVAHCPVCHGAPDLKPGDTIDWNEPLAGGRVWDVPLFGRFVAANITPDRETGIGSLTDGEVARAIRHSVGRTGRILPFMLLATGPMSDEDLTAVVSFIRSRAPVKREGTPEAWGVMAKVLSGSFTPRLDPAPAHVAPGDSPSVERGRYLATGPAACGVCHTPRDPLTFALNGPPLSGSAAMPEADPTNPGFEFVYPNLTPDPETGHITAWDEDTFLQRFRGGRVHAGSTMPWESYQRMTEADIRSVYRFLRSLPPTPSPVGAPYRRSGAAG
jgi:mono/diheme cytochrome c family protein